MVRTLLVHCKPQVIPYHQGASDAGMMMDKTVSILGLGAMGAALARTQLAAGHHTTVWNRSAEKGAALAEQGAMVAQTAAEAVMASGVSLVCIDTSANAEAVLAPVLGRGALQGRTIVQLGTTSPDEARRFAAKITEAGGLALDGAIMSYPDSIGPDNPAPVLLGGDQQGVTAAMPFLQQITANVTELGDNVAAPAALDLGYLTMSLALYAGAAHAARLCEVEGASLDVLTEMSSHGPRAPHRLEIIAKDAFALNSLHDGGSLSVWAAVASNLHQHAQSTGMKDDLTKCLASLYSKAVSAGFGAEDVAALVKLYR